MQKNLTKKMENKDISTIKNAIHAPSFGNTPEGIPQGLENAPSPTNQIKKEEEKGIPIRQMNIQPSIPSQSSKNQSSQDQVMHPQKTSISSESLAGPSSERASFDVIEEIAESIISEKWENLVKNVGDLKLWKERIDTDITGIKQEILRTQSRLENLQTAVMGKVSEYGERITNISAELKALEKVMEKIINPLTKSVKDLQKVTERLKK